MAAVFTSAGGKALLNSSSPIVALPFCLGLWLNVTTIGAGSGVFFLSDAGFANFFGVSLDATTGNLSISGQDGGGFDGVSITAQPAPAGKWTFVLGRFISTTSRRLSVLFPDGSISHVQGTAAKAPAGANQMQLSANIAACDAAIAEFWLASTDMQIDGAQTQEALMRQLAYGGPFSIPSVAANILDYRSLRKHPTNEEAGEVWSGGKGKQTWTNTNGAVIGPHPPLPYWYAKPGQNKRLLTV